MPSLLSTSSCSLSRSLRGMAALPCNSPCCSCCAAAAATTGFAEQPGRRQWHRRKGWNNAPGHVRKLLVASITRAGGVGPQRGGFKRVARRKISQNQLTVTEDVMHATMRSCARRPSCRTAVKYTAANGLKRYVCQASEAFYITVILQVYSDDMLLRERAWDRRLAEGATRRLDAQCCKHDQSFPTITHKQCNTIFQKAGRRLHLNGVLSRGRAAVACSGTWSKDN